MPSWGVYKADLDPDEVTIDAHNYCGKCEYADQSEQLAYAGEHMLSWTFTCPQCGAKIDHEADVSLYLDR